MTSCLFSSQMWPNWNLTSMMWFLWLMLSEVSCWICPPPSYPLRSTVSWSTLLKVWYNIGLGACRRGSNCHVHPKLPFLFLHIIGCSVLFFHIVFFETHFSGIQRKSEFWESTGNDTPCSITGTHSVISVFLKVSGNADHILPTAVSGALVAVDCCDFGPPAVLICFSLHLFLLLPLSLGMNADPHHAWQISATSELKEDRP